MSIQAYISSAQIEGEMHKVLHSPDELRKMQFGLKYSVALYGLFFGNVCLLNAQNYDCQVLLQDKDITNTDWASLEPCLGVANSEGISVNTSENVWRLIKIAFDGVENVPAEVYGKIRLVLPAISVMELSNISMSRVEIVEAFGGVHTLSNDTSNGFNDEQMQLIASKARYEWLGKGPETYSEYDLISMGEIVCHLNESDIERMHADAFKAAAESIGSIESCPQTQLQALAKLASRKDAFGDVKNWSKIDVSIIGNIVNGLTQSELAVIDENKLKLNHFYVQKHKTNGKGRNGKGISAASNTNQTDVNKSHSRKAE
ncbi:uncharacterized protein LOC120775132 [Bactrocera tryoni]|uniref:uncharacterized protein LOC120775132 n=1 Tax=Bactrocera tryoni TaxID=59916 RepID=UPI001A98EFC7|nr:uncharacterized protein LOC120775132 [Bactrocera tryoni]